MDSVPVLEKAPYIGNIEIAADSTNSISYEEFISGEKIVVLTNRVGKRFFYKYDTINNFFNDTKQLCITDPAKKHMLRIPDTNEEITASCIFDRLLDEFKIKLRTAFFKNPILDEITSEEFITDQLLRPRKFTKEELNFIDGNGNTILHLIINSTTNVSNTAILLDLILKDAQTNPELINKVNKDGKTTLDLAVKKYGLNKDNEILSRLINKGGTYAPKKGWSQLFNFGGRRTGKNIKTKQIKKSRKHRKRKYRM